MSHADRFMCTSCSRTVAAFAVCIQSVKRPPENKFSSPVRHPVCAWLIASRKKREIFPKYSLENISLRIVFFYNRYAISIRISPYVLI